MRRAVPIVVLSAMGVGCSHPAPAPDPTPREAPVRVAEAPAEATKAEPPRPPAERSIQLCALAPAEAVGLRTLEAVTVEGRPDTLALLDGRRVPVQEALAGIKVLAGSSWFKAHQSLDLQVGAAVQRYRVYDVARTIEPAALAYLGTADGTPVFAAADDLAAVKSELERLQAAEQELQMRLTVSLPLRARLRAIDVLYVPVQPVGCVFQPMLKLGTP